MMKDKLSDYFKVLTDWEHTRITHDNVLEQISFVFTMDSFKGLYFKTKQDDEYGLNCYQFAFDNDNGIYLNDGDMRFNDFMGQNIKDSGVDVIGFIKSYLIEHELRHLLKL